MTKTATATKTKKAAAPKVTSVEKKMNARIEKANADRERKIAAAKERAEHQESMKRWKAEQRANLKASAASQKKEAERIEGARYKEYDKAFRLAAKFTGDETRPVLTCVQHRADGSLIATDSHRLIRIQNAHSRTEERLIAPDGNDLTGHTYPETARIWPTRFEAELTKVDLNEWIQAHELMLVLVTDKENRVVKLELTSGYQTKVSASMDYVGSAIQLFPSDLADGSLTLAYNAKYMIDALKALRSLGHTTCDMKFAGKAAPFILEAGDVSILILPVRLK